MARCLVAFGSNVGERRSHIDRALELLGFMPGVRLLGVSRYRETVPVGGPAGQPPFLNGACLVETDLAPHDLLGLLQAVEGSLARERTVRWGPRTVDLDLILYDGMVLETDRLTLPHPRMATRRFVLEPSAEIAADLTHPTSGCSVAELLENISLPHPYVAVAGVAGAGSREVAAAVADALFARLVHRPEDGLPWRERLDAWSGPLEEAGCGSDSPDHHGTVSEYWLGSLRLAAARFPPAERIACETAYRLAAERAMRPQVVLLLSSPREVLAERIAYRRSAAAGSSDLFRDIGEAVRGGDDGQVLDGLVREQQDLVDELLGPRNGSAGAAGRPADLPKAVIRIDTGDFGQALAEAVAAVEAMS